MALNGEEGALNILCAARWRRQHFFPQPNPRAYTRPEEPESDQLVQLQLAS